MGGSKLMLLALLVGCGTGKPPIAGGNGGHGGGGGRSAGALGGAGGRSAGSSGGGGAGGKGSAGSTGGSAGGASAGSTGGVGAGGGWNGGAAGGSGSALACALPPAVPSGAVRCDASNPCDPPRPDRGVCYGRPSTNATTTSFTIWVEDPAAPAGGWRVTLGGVGAVIVGGHSYQDMQEGLVGSGGNGLFGDLYVARDGQAKWSGFHFEGVAAYQGGGAWDWPAIMTVSRAGSGTPATVGRHYAITRTGTGSGCNGGTYTFTADDPPRACAFGVDLSEFVLPGV